MAHVTGLLDSAFLHLARFQSVQLLSIYLKCVSASWAPTSLYLLSFPCQFQVDSIFLTLDLNYGAALLCFIESLVVLILIQANFWCRQSDLYFSGQELCLLSSEDQRYNRSQSQQQLRVSMCILTEQSIGRAHEASHDFSLFLCVHSFSHHPHPFGL